MVSSEPDDSTSHSARDGSAPSVAPPVEPELDRLPLVTRHRRIPPWLLVLPAALIAFLIGLLLFGPDNTSVTPDSSPIGFHGGAGEDAPLEHSAIYRDGKLYLSGAVPSREAANALAAKAAEVIGKENVIEDFDIDPSVPNPTHGRVIVDQPFLFEPKRAAISDEYTEILELGVTVMTLNPKVTMVVIGHTDSTGEAEVNIRLSLRRAEAVVDYLVNRGVARSRFELIGKGESEPIADNDSPSGRYANNRIEVILVNLIAN